MMTAIQEELFGNEQYSRLCSICRGEFPRSSEFFPPGRCHDSLASFCRKCANVRVQVLKANRETERRLAQMNLLEKSCEKCRTIKPLREFYMSSHSLDGKTLNCKICIDTKYSERQMRQQRLGDLAWAVYFIQDSRNNNVKIGSCDDPYLTLETLQKGSSEALHLLASHEAGHKESAENIEGALYSLFQAHFRGNGWFEMAPSLEQYISLIQREDYNKAEILLFPMKRTQKKATKQITPSDSVEETVFVEGQKFPSITAASKATGLTVEQLKKYLQNSVESSSRVTRKIPKAS